MTGILIAAGSVLGGGAFAVYPWSTQSGWRLGVAIALWALGGLCFVSAIILSRTSTPDPPLSPRERRQSFERIITDARNRGNEIANPLTRDELKRNVPKWQRDTQNLLEDGLQDSAPSQWFTRLGVPATGDKPDDALGLQITEQIQYLTQLIRDLDALDINDQWNPN